MNQITLATLHQFTTQQVFDYAVEKVKQQGQPSIIAGKCRYRGNNGVKCAAGHLMGDDEYKECFEGCEWSALNDNRDVPDVHLNLICSLQNAHDSIGCCIGGRGKRPFREEWAEETRKVAELYNLNAAICNSETN